MEYLAIILVTGLLTAYPSKKIVFSQYNLKHTGIQKLCTIDHINTL